MILNPGSKIYFESKPECACTVCFIDEDNNIATSCCHCASYVGENVFVKQSDQRKEYIGSVVSLEKDIDLAVIRLREDTRPEKEILLAPITEVYEKAKKIFVGNSWMMTNWKYAQLEELNSRYYTFSTGIECSLYGITPDKKFLIMHSDITLSKGFSGSPVVVRTDKNDYIVGMVSARLKNNRFCFVATNIEKIVEVIENDMGRKIQTKNFR